ncbi:MAG: hypothetical protein FJY81_01875, partial [Candidatus Aminicenantes bacterium]|nr:hypothetical protein [Candidatus Aminicenantes bacterium]
MQGREKRVLKVAALAAGAFLAAQFAAISLAPEENTPARFMRFAVSEVQGQAVKSNVIGRPKKVIDLLPLAGAKTTQWTNGNVSLPFPGEETDERGFACYRENVELEDGNVYQKALETHPEWKDEH